MTRRTILAVALSCVFDSAAGTQFSGQTAPRSDTDTDTGHRGVSDPSGARGTHSSRRGGVAHATVPFHLNRNRSSGAAQSAAHLPECVPG